VVNTYRIFKTLREEAEEGQEKGSGAPHKLFQFFKQLQSWERREGVAPQRNWIGRGGHSPDPPFWQGTEAGKEANTEKGKIDFCLGREESKSTAV